MTSQLAPSEAMRHRPLVSIIVVSYNNREFIRRCLSCALNQDYDSIEAIVVDQNSADGTWEIIRAEFPRVTLIQNEINTGFADGMNRGIEASKGEYVLLLNSDLFLHSTFVSQALREFVMSSEERLGMCAGIVYRDRGGPSEEIDCLGTLLLPYHAVVSSENRDVRKWVLGPAGSSMFFRRVMLDDIRLPNGDYLDSTFFCYGEDIEVTLRAQLLGWRCLYAPIVVGWHIGSASVGRLHGFTEKPTALLRHAAKNRYLTVLTCYPIPLLLRTFPWNLLGEVGQIAVFTVTGRWALLRALFGAYWAVLSMVPYVLAKRRWLQRGRRVSCAYLRSLYAPWGPIRVFRSLLQKV